VETNGQKLFSGQTDILFIKKTQVRRTMPAPTVKDGKWSKERERTKSGRWRKKRSDANQPRKKKSNRKYVAAFAAVIIVAVVLLLIYILFPNLLKFPW